MPLLAALAPEAAHGRASQPPVSQPLKQSLDGPNRRRAPTWPAHKHREKMINI